MKKLIINTNNFSFVEIILHQKSLCIILLLSFIHFLAPVNNSLFGQWKLLEPTYGGRGECFYVDGNEVFLGTNGGGIYYSSDFGQNWSSRNNGLAYYMIRAIDKLGTTLFASNPHGIHISTDNGNTWHFQGLGTIEDVYGLIVKDSLVFTGTFFGRIYRSSDLGITWEMVHYSAEGITPVYKFRIFNNSIIACLKGDNGGVLISDDNGDNWKYYNSGLTNPDVSDITWIGDTLFLADANNGVYKSKYPKLDWTPVNNGISEDRMASIYAFNGCVFAGALYDKLYKTTNNGAAWTEISDGLIDGDINEITSINNDLMIGVPYDGILRSSNNGDTWEPFNHGLHNINVSSISCKNNLVFVSVYGKGIFVSDDKGSTWELVSENIPDKYILSLEHNNNTIFAGTYHHGIYRSFDNGQTWEPANNGIDPNGRIDKIKANGDTVLANLDGLHVRKSFSNGDSWGTGNIPYNADATDFEFLNNVTLAGTAEDGIYRSTNLSLLTWTQLFSWPRIIRDLDKEGNTIYAATIEVGMLKSEDEGVSWESIHYNLPSLYAETITIAHNNLIVGLWIEGLYEICLDGSNHWNFIGNVSGVDYPNYSNLTFANDYLYTSVDNFGLWAYAYPPLGEKELTKSDGSKLIVSLNQHKLNVSIKPPQNFSHARIKITSLMGSTVYNSIFIGNQINQINTSNFTPGIYIVNIHSDSKVLIQKIFIY